jgi:2-polyprenyl-3-methyl-5-hydroxy-6-metoxy-1,4-benzoquinol methylase
MTTKIGIDISAKDYWAERTKNYLAGLDGPYHRHRLQMVRALCEGLDLHGKNCIDFGCGEGIFADFLTSGGAIVTGFDIEPKMIELARTRSAGTFEVGGVECIARLETGSVDALFALNVLAYFTAEEEAEFYRQTRRVLRPGGSLVVTHSNELFDMYTFNRYTTAFFQKHFNTDIASLVAHPDKPDRRTFSIRENPLSYGAKLARLGFREVRQEFMSFHPKPPLLIPGWAPDDINSREYRSTLDWPAEERWKLMFQCSMFGSHAQSVG